MRTHFIWGGIAIAAFLIGMQVSKSRAHVVEKMTEVTKPEKETVVTSVADPVLPAKKPEKSNDPVPTRRKLETYAWMKSHNKFLSFSASTGDGFGWDLAILLGLDPGEIARL